MTDVALSKRILTFVLSLLIANSAFAYHVNERPVAKNVTFNVDKNGQVIIIMDELGYADKDGDALDHITITALPVNGTLFVDLDGDRFIDDDERVTFDQQISADLISNKQLIYLPHHDESGVHYAEFDFNVSDGKSNAAVDNIVIINVVSKLKL